MAITRFTRSQALESLRSHLEVVRLHIWSWLVVVVVVAALEDTVAAAVVLEDY